MNMRVSEEFGQYFVRLPLRKAPHIVCGNALSLDWREVVPPAELSYIVGNPPFMGKKEQKSERKSEVLKVFTAVKGAGVLDYVACWYLKATEIMAYNPDIRTALVSTNSITQGEQVGVLWPDLLRRGVNIHFAHRTFQWSSEARGKAAVHCVIIGFGLGDVTEKWIFDYETPQSDPHLIRANHINPYLIDAANIILPNRQGPVCAVPQMSEGSALLDEGNFLFSEDEAKTLWRQHPQVKPFLRPFVWGDGFLNGERKYCLWLQEAGPKLIREVPEIKNRIKAVQDLRNQSSRPGTKRQHPPLGYLGRSVNRGKSTCLFLKPHPKGAPISPWDSWILKSFSTTPGLPSPAPPSSISGCLPPQCTWPG